jgi:hypothetical protein
VHSGEAELGHLLLRGNYMTTSTVVARRDVLDEAGLFRTDIWAAEDWDCWLRVAQRSSVAYLAEPVAGYRVHPSSITAGYTPTRWLRIHLEILDRTFASPRLPASCLGLRRGAVARLDAVVAELAYSNRRLDLTRSYAGKALVAAMAERQWRRGLDCLWLIARSVVPDALHRPLQRASRRSRMALSRADRWERPAAVHA